LDFYRKNSIYRIDHYLARKRFKTHGVAVLATHFRADLESAVYSITSNHRAETVGVELRGGYYNQAARCGIWSRSLFQLVTLMAMEPPSSFDANIVREEQTKVLRALPPMTQGRSVCALVRAYGEGEKAAQSAGLSQ